MLKNIKARIFHRPRKYPIKYDEYGRSLRERAFELFDKAKKPDEVSAICDMEFETARRYYYQWNKCPPKFEQRYGLMKAILKNKGELSLALIDAISTSLGMPKYKVTAMLSRPWGIKQLLLGTHRYPREKAHSAQEARLRIALKFMGLIENSGMPLEKLEEVLVYLIKMAAEYEPDEAEKASKTEEQLSIDQINRLLLKGMRDRLRSTR